MGSAQRVSTGWQLKSKDMQMLKHSACVSHFFQQAQLGRVCEPPLGRGRTSRQEPQVVEFRNHHTKSACIAIDCCIIHVNTIVLH